MLLTGQAFARLDGLADAALAAEQLGGSSSRSAGRRSKSQRSGGGQQRSGRQQAGGKRKRLQDAVPASRPCASASADLAAANDGEDVEAEGVTPPSKQRKRSRTDLQPAAAPASKHAPSKHRRTQGSNGEHRPPVYCSMASSCCLSSSVRQCAGSFATGKAMQQLSASGTKPASGRKSANNRTAHVSQPSAATAIIATPRQQQPQQQPQGHQGQQRGGVGQTQGVQSGGLAAGRARPAAAATPHPRTPAAAAAPADTSWTPAQVFSLL